MTPPLGLLLDVDGPIASPVTRTIAIPSIAADLVALANAGVPVVFNTGRSDEFLQGEVVGPLVEGGLRDEARVFGVCEKGAVWFRITPEGVGDLTVDDSLLVPSQLREQIARLVAEQFADSMFFDDTKRTMVSVEQRTDVDSDHYLGVQPDFDRAVLDLCRTDDIGALWRSERHPAADGSIRYRLDPSIISTDIESVRVGKDLGAERALDLVAATGAVPTLWRTVGDSRGDYAMADWMHGRGFDVAHVDVRPAEGVPEKPYDVLTESGVVNDAAGAVFLRRWAVEHVGA
ncbi:hypothetical protein GCM10009851_28730 [Herbiconiux moechotypicola]|uniref:Hydroxymethylpyrimidine pyrophosphatase-like HAD family hydrolase n=1 Tax=Herbiconiux moechotypicola TaxID=637393 RepID=A0ABN3DTU6_9MICO